MQRWIAVVTLLVASLLSATPAEAFHHRHFGWGGGWGGGWGHRGWGYGGYGYRGWGGGYYGGYRSFYRGYGGYGGYGWGYPGYGYGGIGYGGLGYRGFGYGYPYYGVGYSPSYYSYPSYYPTCSPWYGAANYGGVNVGVPVSTGYPVYASATRGPTVTLIATTAKPAVSAPLAAAPVVATRPIANAVQQFLGMSELRPSIWSVRGLRRCPNRLRVSSLAFRMLNRGVRPSE